MRAKFNRRGVIVLLAVGAAACGRETAAPVLDPSLSHQAGGAGGAVIVRGTRLTFLAHLDAARGLLSIHAPATLCLDGTFNSADAQFVLNPSEIEQFIAKLQTADEVVAVYAATSFADAGMIGSAETAGLGGIVDVGTFCAFLQGPALVASGSVRRVSTFSNASFAAHWTGDLTAVDGSRVGITEVYQLTADAQDPNNPATWMVNASSILLR